MIFLIRPEDGGTVGIRRVPLIKLTFMVDLLYSARAATLR